MAKFGEFNSQVGNEHRFYPYINTTLGNYAKKSLGIKEVFDGKRYKLFMMVTND